MTPQLALIKLRLRLNKSHSSDYDNIPDWVAVEAIRKAFLQIVRRTIHGANRTQEGDEETRLRIDDLQFLLTTNKIGGNNKNDYFLTDKLPDNYLYYKNLEVIASNESCSKKRIYSILTQEANVQKYLNDWSLQPDFTWRSTFHTISNDTIKIYRKDFEVDEVNLTYYRKPVQFDVHGYTHEDGSSSANVDLEAKDDLAEIVLDEAEKVISADLEIMNQYQTSNQSTDINI